MLAHFLGVSAPPEFLNRLSGAQLKERLLSVLRDVFLGASELAPLIFIVENMHWIDAASEEFLGHLANGLPGHRVLLLLTTRPGYTASWLTAPLAHYQLKISGGRLSGVGLPVGYKLVVDDFDLTSPTSIAVTLPAHTLQVTVTGPTGNPVRNAVVEIWQCDNRGVYLHSSDSGRRAGDKNFQGFGRFLTGAKGEYYFRTIKPVPYPGRTPHIHVKVKRGGRELLTSQLFINGHPQNARDGVFRGVRDPFERELVLVDFKPV